MTIETEDHAVSKSWTRGHPSHSDEILAAPHSQIQPVAMRVRSLAEKVEDA